MKFNGLAAGSVFLAPMAGFTDLAFRTLCASNGAQATVTEMVSAKALCFGDKKSFSLLKRNTNSVCGVQIFGNEPDCFSQALEILYSDRIKEHFDFADINAGCPMPKIAGKSGAGVSLMGNPELLGKIITSCVRTAEKLPGKPSVTIKIRAGLNACGINAPYIAQLAEALGISAVTIHGRTKEQLYSGKTDLSVIERTVRSVSVPVIGNGDISCLQDAAKMIERTGCRYTTVGRGALGNPFLFSGRRPDLSGILETMRHHAALCVRDKGEILAFKELRKHFAHYLKGFPCSAKFRQQASKISCSGEFEELIRKIETSEMRLIT